MAWLEEELESLDQKVKAMARTPFYGRGPGPQIARMDMQAATAPGRAYGQMFASLGKTAGDAIETYSKNKQRGEMLDGQIGTILAHMTPEKQKEMESSSFKPQLDKFLTGEMSNSKKESFFGSLMLDMKMDEQQRQTEHQVYLRSRQEAMDTREGILDKRQKHLWKKQLQDEQATKDFNRFLFAEGGPTPLDPDPFAPPPDRQFLPPPAERFMQTEEGKEEARRIAESEMSDQAKMQAFQSVMARETAQVPKGTSTVTLMGEDGKPYHWRIDSAGTPIQRIGPAQIQPSALRTVEDEVTIYEKKGASEANMKFLEVLDTNLRATMGSGETARNALATLNRLPDDAKTGGFTESINTLKKYLSSAGVPFEPSTMENIATTEHFMRQSGEFLFQSIQKTKGSISDSEMRTFQSMNPGMVQTRAGNLAMLNFIIAAGDRAKRKLRYKQDLQAEELPAYKRVRLLDEFDGLPENQIIHHLTGTPGLLGDPNASATPAPPRTGAKQVQQGGGVIQTSSGGTFTPR